MKTGKQIDKTRLMFFTDALLAIIMTILVLDIKAPEMPAVTNNSDFLKTLLTTVSPHFFGFIISFALIVSLWLSHHDLMASLKHADRTFTILNFLFVGTTATLPFSTALVAANPSQSYAVSILALNMFIMTVFLSALHIYSGLSGLKNPDYFTPLYERHKRILGVGGSIVILIAVFVSFLSPVTALVMIAAVPLIHLITARKAYSPTELLTESPAEMKE